MNLVLEKILIPLLAACLGAIIAFRYQRVLELKRDKRAVIQTLMMYRNIGADELEFIKALNAIDIVFNKDTKVRELFHTYIAETRPNLFHNNKWIETFNQLIFEMAKCTEYKNLSLQEIREYYEPEALRNHYPNSFKYRIQTPPHSIDSPIEKKG